MDKKTLGIVDASLQRCFREPRFLDLFYERFLAASPKVQERFAGTDFERQKRALRGSLWMILLAAEDEEKGPERYLGSLAEMHSARHLDIGAELYDLWLDSLLATVAECDPEHTPELRAAWERVMMVGVHYMVTRYNR
ncbi:MAG TPA: globin [Vicinamibacteria bacterium]|nr:globin [Vicinamibacteria bacterium]